LSESDPFAVISHLRSQHNITHLDVVISNSGIAKYVGEVITTPPQELRDHFYVNTVSHLLLFQAAWPMLKEAKGGEPKFVIVSSSVGSIGAMEKEPVAMVSYGCSKAATNFLSRKIHFENEGWVDTDMGWDAAKKAYGLEQPPKDAVLDPSALKPLTVQESVDAMLEQGGGLMR
ncbi:MAG: hypothetical protein Q9218_005146, partial [Villophora microphyllina]